MFSLIKSFARLQTVVPAVAMLASLAMAAPVRADLTPWYSDSISAQQTNWDLSVSLPKFNPALGTLTGIEFKLEGIVSGDFGAINLSDQSGNTLDGHLSSTVTLTRPDNTTLVVALPEFVQTANLGINPSVDFSFTAPYGAYYAGLSGSDTASAITSTPSDLALFTGPGTIVLPIGAIASSYATGTTGNEFTLFLTSAGATASVRYEYTPVAVPEPSSVALMGLGGLGLLALHRRRQARSVA